MIDIIVGDCRTELGKLEDQSVHTCVTSPPYWGLRDYGVDGQIGLEQTPESFVEEMVGVFREVRRVLRDDGTLWLNLGDSYINSPGGFQGKNGQRASRTFTAKTDFKKTGDGLKTKDLVGIPWMVAFALRSDGWYLRSDIIWHKPNPMPEPVEDRPTRAHEYIFLLSKSERYYYDSAAIRTQLQPKTFTAFGTTPKSKGNDAGGFVKSDNWAQSIEERKPRLDEDGNIAGANKRSVWTVATHPFKEAHFATFPEKLIEPCILAGAPSGGWVLDPFAGAFTTGVVAITHGRSFRGIELNPAYAEIGRKRLAMTQPGFVFAEAAE